MAVPRRRFPAKNRLRNFRGSFQIRLKMFYRLSRNAEITFGGETFEISSIADAIKN